MWIWQDAKSNYGIENYENHSSIGLFHLKVWEGEERKFFFDGGGRGRIMNYGGGGGVEFWIIFRSSTPPLPTTLLHGTALHISIEIRLNSVF